MSAHEQDLATKKQHTDERLTTLQRKKELASVSARPISILASR